MLRTMDQIDTNGSSSAKNGGESKIKCKYIGTFRHERQIYYH